jgi:ESCRT-II complex subunit VPS36
MALKRFSTAVDGTIPVVALLYNDEELLGSQDTVGIYDGYALPTKLCVYIH